MSNIGNWIEPFRELLSPSHDFSFRLMRFFGRIFFVRKWIARNTSKPLISSLDTVVNTHVENLQTQGYSTGLKLSDLERSEIIKHCDQSLFYDSQEPDKKYPIFFNEPKRQGEGFIYRLLDPHLKNETINKIATSELIKSTADIYLGVDAKLMGTQLWYTFPSKENEYNPEFGFHYDLDDYGFLKIFFYLDAVTERNGPHQIIESSHNHSQIFRFFNRRLSEDQVASRFKDKVITMLGQAGEGFFEDTFAYHRGTVARENRLIFQIQYAVSSHKWNN